MNGGRRRVLAAALVATIVAGATLATMSSAEHTRIGSPTFRHVTVEIGGKEVTRFDEMTNLRSQLEAVVPDEGTKPGSTGSIYTTKHGQASVTLKRTLVDGLYVNQWHAEAAANLPAGFRDCDIVARGPDDVEIARYRLTAAWPLNIDVESSNDRPIIQTVRLIANNVRRVS